MFSASTYIARRKRLKQELGPAGIVLLLGNDECPMSFADNTYRFRQDSTFLYYFGLDRAGLAAVIDLDEGTETVFGRELTLDDIVWTGVLPTLRDDAARAGVVRTAEVDELPVVLQRTADQCRRIHFLPPYRAEHRLKLLQLLGHSPEEQNGLASALLIRAVVAQRICKSDEEIAEIERAVDTSVQMHLAAMTMARPGMVEAQLAAEVRRIALAAGGDIAYPIILTVNGQTLHNHDHGNTLQPGAMVLCDLAAETAAHYAADLSSTFPVSPSFATRQREVYAVTLAAHEAAVAALRPGVPFLEVHLAACRVIAQGMKDLQLLRGNVDDAVAAGAHAMFFPCGTGHLLGLDVHDMEALGEHYAGYDEQPRSTQFGLKSLRLARKLQPGYVLTIEPGIYFIPELIDRWRGEGRHRDFLDYDRLEAYRDFSGIRNEENFLVTDSGHRLLGSRVKPKTIDEVEAARGYSTEGT